MPLARRRPGLEEVMADHAGRRSPGDDGADHRQQQADDTREPAYEWAPGTN
ncbi:hypothetical protein ACHWUR_29420 [Klebsiella pneumoniae]